MGHCPVFKTENFTTSFVRPGKVSFQLCPPFHWPPWGKGKQEENNIVSFFFTPYLPKQAHQETSLHSQHGSQGRFTQQSPLNRKMDKGKLIPHTDKSQFKDLSSPFLGHRRVNVFPWVKTERGFRPWLQEVFVTREHRIKRKTARHT